jgi:hypothetical protein
MDNFERRLQRAEELLGRAPIALSQQQQQRLVRRIIDHALDASDAELIAQTGEVVGSADGCCVMARADHGAVTAKVIHLDGEA